MRCSVCGQENDDNAQFCKSCGARLDVKATMTSKCPVCGTENDDNAQFCKSCGAQLSAGRPTPYPRPVYQTNTRLETASLILGIVTIVLGVLCCCFPYIAIVVGPIGIVVGIIAIVKGARTKAIVGLVLSVIGFFVSLIMLISLLSFDMNEFCQENPDLCDQMCEVSPDGPFCTNDNNR